MYDRISLEFPRKPWVKEASTVVPMGAREAHPLRQTPSIEFNALDNARLIGQIRFKIFSMFCFYGQGIPSGILLGLFDAQGTRLTLIFESDEGPAGIPE